MIVSGLTSPLTGFSHASKESTASGDGIAFELGLPTKTDGHAIHGLVADCPPLDLNSVYTYLLLCEHFTNTCVLATADGIPQGFVSAYIPPNKPDVLFVWQVAVHTRNRGRGLGRLMLNSLLNRTHLGDIRYIETTVSPDNPASRRMFDGLARSLGASIQETPLFGRDLFGAQAHQDEPLLRIGPFAMGSGSHTRILP